MGLMLVASFYFKSEAKSYFEVISTEPTVDYVPGSTWNTSHVFPDTAVIKSPWSGNLITFTCQVRKLRHKAAGNLVQGHTIGSSRASIWTQAIWLWCLILSITTLCLKAQHLRSHRMVKDCLQLSGEAYKFSFLARHWIPSSYPRK